MICSTPLRATASTAQTPTNEIVTITPRKPSIKRRSYTPKDGALSGFRDTVDEDGVRIEWLDTPPIMSTSPLIYKSISFAYEPFYRVILVYTNWTNDSTVAEKVRASCRTVTFTEALKTVRYSKIHGGGIVCTVLKDEADIYSNNMKKRGLTVLLDEA